VNEKLISKIKEKFGVKEKLQELLNHQEESFFGKVGKKRQYSE